MHIRPLPADWRDHEERFDRLVDRRGAAECWPWLGGANKWGRGMFHVPGAGTFLAPRLAWALANGIDPGSEYVLHACDRPSCCNPRHLRLGSHSDNVRDAVTRGRHNNTAKTQCLAGHLFSNENTYVNPKGERQCRTCQRRRRREFEDRAKASR